MKKKVFVMYGESQRGDDQLLGKEWIEGNNSSETIKEVLLSKFSGLYSGEGLDEYMKKSKGRDSSAIKIKLSNLILFRIFRYN